MKKTVRLIAVALIVVGCKSDQSPTTGFGTRIEPPAGLYLGMPIEAARAALPTLGDGEKPNARLSSQVTLLVRTGDGRIRALFVMFDPDLTTDAIVGGFTKLWGPPEPVASSLTLEWKSEATGWRAELVADQGPSLLRFHRYRPVTPAYFGKTVAPPGPLSQLRIGMTVAEVQAVVPDFDGLPKEMAPGRSLAHVDGGGNDLVGNLWFDGEQRIYAVSLDLPSAAKAERVIGTAWGPGKRETDANGKPAETWLDPQGVWQAQLVRREVHVGLDAIIEAGELIFSKPIAGASR